MNRLIRRLALTRDGNRQRRQDAGAAPPRPTGRLPGFVRFAAAAVALCFAAGPAGANPKGGRVTAGSATIDQASPGRLDITQSTDRAIIDWQSFNIAPSEWTAFRQPGPGAATLNRVDAGDPSVIAGRLTANGALVLINRSGVTFANGAQVNVNSLIATPTDISNANFMAGRMRFDRPSANPRARIVNRGSITVAEHGLAALVGPGAENSGIIQAKLGRVVIAGAKTYTVDLYGDGLISFDVGSNVTEVPAGPGGKPAGSLVANSGRIEAPGGTVLLTADAAGGIVGSVVDAAGEIDARSIGNRTGRVTIDAGPGGSARLSGTIDVSGTKPGEKGGTATVTGQRVYLARSARIDASGDAGGGTVRIGGGRRGRDRTVRDAVTTTVAGGAFIDASATGKGAGGEVTVWSDRATRFAGTILAQGGRRGGNGGAIETSGAALDIANGAIIDAGAPKGKAGSWLLDPTDIEISGTKGNSNITLTTPFHGTAATSVLSTKTLNAALATTNVVVETTSDFAAPLGGTITIDADATISWTSAHSLTLTADNAIVVDGRIQSTHGAVVLDALTGGITISGQIRGPATGFGFGETTYAVSLIAAGAIAETPTGTVIAQSLRALTQNDAGAPITLANAGNDVTIVTLTALDGPDHAVRALAAGAISFADSVGFTIDGVTGKGVGGLEQGVGTTASAVLAGGGTIDEVVVAGVRIAAQNLSVRTLSDTDAAIVLNNPANAVPGNVTLSALDAAGTAAAPAVVAFFDSTGFTIAAQPGNGLNGEEIGVNTAGTATLQAGGPLLETGAIAATNLVARTLLDAGAAITLDAAANAIPGNVTLSALNAAGTAPAAGAISFVDGSGFAVAAQPGDGLNGQEIGVNTTADAALTGGGAVRIDGSISAKGVGSFIELTAAGDIAIGGPIVAATVTLDATGGGVSQTATGVITADFLDITSVGAVSLPQANSVGTLAFSVTGAGNGFLFRSTGRDLTLGVDDGTTDGTNGGAITVAVTGTAATGFDLTLPTLEFLASNGGTITLSAGGPGGTFTNGAVIDSTSKAGAGNIVVLADAMFLAAGKLDAGTATVVLGPATATLAIVLGAPPITAAPAALLLTQADLASVTAEMLQIGYRNENGTPSLTGSITIAVPLAINTAQVPDLLLVTGGAVTELAGASLGPTRGSPPLALGIIAGDPVSLGGANAVGTLAGFVDGAGESFLFRDSGVDLTIGALARPTLGVAFNADGIPSSAVMTGPARNPLSGVTTAGGNIALETTTRGNLALDDPVDAGAGAVGLASAGTLTQDPGPITASTLAIIAAGRVSLGAFGGTSDANRVGTLAAEVLGAGQSFVFRNDALTLTIGTVALATDFGAQFVNPITLAALPATLSGVTTVNANIGLRVTRSGDLVLAANVDAGTAGVGLEAAGAITQTAGILTAATLEVSAAGPVSLPDANAVAVLAGQTTGGGAGTFLFRDDGRDLTIGTAPVLRESGTGTPPNDQMLSVGSLSGVTTAGGNIALETTTRGNLALAQDVDARAGLIALVAAGNLAETDNAAVTAAGLIADAAGAVNLGNANAIAALAGLAGGAFRFVDADALTVGSVGPVLGVARQSGVATTSGDVVLRTNAGDLTLANSVSAGGGNNAVALVAAGNAVETGGTVTASSLIVDAALNVFFGITEAGGTVRFGVPNSVGTLAGSAGGIFAFLNGPALTIGTLPGVLDVVSRSGITASSAATGDILIQVDDTGQPLILAAGITGGGRTVLAANGGFAQTGVVAVTTPVLAIDTTGAGVAALLGVITAANVNAGVIAGLPPSGTGNAMQFADLTAPNTTVLLIAGTGTVAGSMTVGQLGLSGNGSAANLFGSIAGVGGPTAALLGARNPGPEATYLFNGCVIASAFCTAQPPAFLVTPALPAETVTAPVPLPVLTATVNFVTPEPVQGNQPANIDAPVINIFDEERLCAQTANPSQASKERCPERRQR